MACDIVLQTCSQPEEKHRVKATFGVYTVPELGRGLRNNRPSPLFAGGLDKRLPTPGLWELVWTFAGSYLSILAISALNRFVGEEKGILFLVGSFGASAVLLFGVTESKLAQPRNVCATLCCDWKCATTRTRYPCHSFPLAPSSQFVGGQILSSLVGLGLRHAIHIPWVVSPLAMALSLTAMQLTSTTHPPGGATALIIASMEKIPRWAGFSYVAGVAGGCALMLPVALIVNNLSPHRRYPTFWW